MRPEIRFTPPRRARRRIAGFVIPMLIQFGWALHRRRGEVNKPWMLSRRILRWRLAPPLPRPYGEIKQLLILQAKKSEETHFATFSASRHVVQIEVLVLVLRKSNEMMGVRIQNEMTPRSSCVLIYTLDTRWLCRISLLLIMHLVSHVWDAL